MKEMMRLQIDFMVFLQILLYLVLVVLIVIFAILGIKLIKVIGKADRVLDELEEKIHKTDTIFGFIDHVSDYTAMISDKVVGGIFNFITGLFRKKGRDKDE